MAKKPAGDRTRARRREPWWAYAYLAAVLAFVVGLLGAGAFNPDNGFLLHSEILWSVFGIAAYFGLALIYVLVLMAAGRLVLWVARRIRRSHESAL